jgi:hypothetical protein
MARVIPTCFPVLLTPNFSWVADGRRTREPFQRFPTNSETVETVSRITPTARTWLKPGVNEIGAVIARNKSEIRNPKSETMRKIQISKGDKRAVRLVCRFFLFPILNLFRISDFSPNVPHASRFTPHASRIL